jgi:hypothetical protein
MQDKEFKEYIDLKISVLNTIFFIACFLSVALRVAQIYML